MTTRRGLTYGSPSNELQAPGAWGSRPSLFSEECERLSPIVCAGAPWWAYETAADIGDFLRRRLALTAGGGLLFAGGADAAFGFVTGFHRRTLLRFYV